ncbi:Succinate dehydrogenase assembly factor 2 mitochondrial [Mycoemilia scoparia]|uniref:Succinate dehydrogenase assembly factor 2, mitochondrial n=1 Tax=Mycoemilia scoparia TaxID=417184 RepID=A0A9W8DQW3_9FUNG|nr:Succinate dehydrogenase assembly factor 2 mitochondrial [Mycoemilia scoparia]
MLSIIPRSAALGIAVIHRKGYTSVLCAIRGVQTKAPSSSEIQPIDRSHEQTEVKRRRLVWQTRKRGILESDLLLSTFASKSLPTMSHKELEEFDQLLDHMDWDIFHWASGAKAAPEEVKSMSIFKKLEEHCQSRTNKGVRMPDL